MRYVWLLRGINVGGKNRVVMSELKSQILALGYGDVTSYINSGNLFFSAQGDKSAVEESLHELLEHNYSFEIPFALIPAEAYIAEAASLPAWWNEAMDRKDVLFFTSEVDRAAMQAGIEAMKLGNERIYFGEIAIFWGKYSLRDYSRTAYAKYLIRQPFYKQVTIRNGNTFHRIAELLRK